MANYEEAVSENSKVCIGNSCRGQLPVLQPKAKWTWEGSGNLEEGWDSGLRRACGHWRVCVQKSGPGWRTAHSDECSWELPASPLCHGVRQRRTKKKCYVPLPALPSPCITLCGRNLSWSDTLQAKKKWCPQNTVPWTQSRAKKGGFGA